MSMSLTKIKPIIAELKLLSLYHQPATQTPENENNALTLPFFLHLTKVPGVLKMSREKFVQSRDFIKRFLKKHKLIIC